MNVVPVFTELGVMLGLLFGTMIGVILAPLVGIAFGKVAGVLTFLACLALCVAMVFASWLVGQVGYYG